MANEVVSRHVGSAGEILLLIPLKPGFAPVSELVVSYATRLRSLLETLSELRVRKFQRGFGEGSGPVERLQTLHRVQWTVMESQQVPPGARQLPGAQLLVSAHFDSSWEDYLHRLRDETGKLLDLIFSHCAGYEGNTCQDDYENFRKWIRDHQRPCNFLYAASPEQTSDDVRFLKAWMAKSRSGQPQARPGERAPTSPQSDGSSSAADLASVRVPGLGAEPRPETRHERDRSAFRTLHGLAELRDRLFSTSIELGDRTGYGLFDAAIKTVLEREQDVTDHLERSKDRIPYPPVEPIDEITGRVVAPIEWARKLLAPRSDTTRDAEPRDVEKSVPQLDGLHSNVQGNLLRGYPGQEHGCVLLLICRDADAWKQLLELLEQHLTTAARQESAPRADTLRVNFALTFTGLQRLGMAQEVLDQFPTEFRQGMEARAALLGDSHSHDPYNWQRPVRNGFHDATGEHLQLTAVDALITLHANEPFVAPSDALRTRLEPLGLFSDGIQIVHVQPLSRSSSGHFGLVDGVSQPIPAAAPSEVKKERKRDLTALGEFVLGCDNNRAVTASCADAKKNPRSFELFKYGSFLAVRKIMQDSSKFEAYAREAANEGATKQLKAAASKQTSSDAFGDRSPKVLDALGEILGRQANGEPLPGLRKPEATGLNNFDYSKDPTGAICPLHAHIRLANPRWETEAGELPVTRILRRGMSYASDERSERGLLFMAYNASLADQFEVIQRWLNGSNVTGLHSAQHDLLTAPIREEEGPHYVLRKAEDGTESSYQTLPRRRAPFTQLRWGLYLFAPALGGVQWLRREILAARANEPVERGPEHVRAAAKRAWQRVVPALPQVASRAGQPSARWALPLPYVPSIERGRARIRELDDLPAHLGRPAWKKLLEESVLPDSPQARETEDVWAAIRADGIGIKVTPLGVLVSNEIGARHVLGDDGSTFSVSEYARRIVTTSGDHYLAHDVKEPAPALEPPRPKATYAELSVRPNERLGELSRDAFALAYQYSTEFLSQPGSLEREPEDSSASPPRTGVGIRDLARVVIARLCQTWFDMPLLSTKANPNDPASFARALDPYLVCSRHAFQHTPEPRVEEDARVGGAVVQQIFPREIREQPPSGEYLESGIALALLKDEQYLSRLEDEKLARIRETLIGSIVGFAPPTYGSVNRVIDQWVESEQLWTIQQQVIHALDANVARELREHQNLNLGVDQAAILRGDERAKLADNPALRALLAQAMGGTPSPLTLYRTTKRAIELDGQFVAPGTKLIVGMASVVADARSLGYSEPEVWFFGGAHGVPSTGQPGSPHGCPAREAGLRVILGVLVALCERKNVRRERRGVLSFDRA